VSDDKTWDGMRIKLLFVSIVALGIAITLGCDSSVDENINSNPLGLGDATFTFSGPPSVASERKMYGEQMPACEEHNAANAVKLRITDDQDSLRSRGRTDGVVVELYLPSAGYRGPGVYSCGLDPAKGIFDGSTFCDIGISHSVVRGNKPGIWTTECGPKGHRRNCNMTVTADDASNFAGTLVCDDLTSCPVLFPDSDTDHPDLSDKLEVNGTWSFSSRKIFDWCQH
jgi:hypothetical protein